MRQWIVVSLLFCLIGAAYANPVVVAPLDGIGYTIVLGSASAVEAAIVTFILLFWGVDPLRFYIALILGNLLIYFAVFLPLLDASSNLLLSETAIVLLDGSLIKIITRYNTFQQVTFCPLKWPYALAIAACGNIVSYYVGAAIA